MQQAARRPQPGPPSHLVWPLPTLQFFPIMHENPNVREKTQVHMEKTKFFVWRNNLLAAKRADRAEV